VNGGARFYVTTKISEAKIRVFLILLGIRLTTPISLAATRPDPAAQLTSKHHLLLCAR
jgi:hypothetical protein